jgi:preprotein translocase subunit SecE
MKFEIYKRGQGKYTRLCSAFGIATIVALGCLQLYQWLDATITSTDPRTALWISTMVPSALLVVLALLIFWLVNKPSVADFMISAEGELKKVSWSSRREIAVSTLIVIIVVAIMAVLLFATDMFFQVSFNWLLA